MRKHRTPATPAVRPAFDPVAARLRQDGWTPERQTGFIEALAECGCVDEACKRVGMGTSSAYALRRRGDARSFRAAWDAAIDVAVERLSDAAFARALHGVATPVFYKGEQVGERVRHDERLTMFLLRYRDPTRYGAWIDGCRAERAPDGAALALATGTAWVAKDARAAAAGGRVSKRSIEPTTRYISPQEQAVAAESAEAERQQAARRGYRATPEETDAALLKLLRAVRPSESGSGADAACGSSTSDPDRGPGHPSRRSVAGSDPPP
ncbi:hypothetical protein [uncultured Sphingomonas sp.]|uniref:hypothetical protein n=1 Tax=uncultured Sphingomonas sp. TaxID=158754 RepID=UPI0035CA370E